MTVKVEEYWFVFSIIIGVETLVSPGLIRTRKGVQVYLFSSHKEHLVELAHNKRVCVGKRTLSSAQRRQNDCKSCFNRKSAQHK